MPRRLLSALIIILVLPALAAAQSIPSATDLPTGKRPKSRHVWNAVAAGWNQIVFGDQIKLYRKLPWGQGKTLLTSDSHWRYGINAVMSPAYNRPAIMLGVSPLLIMDLDVSYGPGINVFQFTYDSYKVHFDPMDLGTPDYYGGVFHQAEANLVLKAAAWRFAVLHTTDFFYTYSKEYYFNWDAATIIKDGFMFRDKSFLLFQVAEEWRIFADYENFQHRNSAFLTELVATGFVFTRPAFNNFTFIAQLGYHTRNPQFSGLKYWAAAIMEWDFPDKK